RSKSKAVLKERMRRPLWRHGLPPCRPSMRLSNGSANPIHALGRQRVAVTEPVAVTEAAAGISAAVIATRVSEVRLVRSWDLGVSFGAIFVRVISADIFQPLAQWAPVSYGRRPRRREYCLIVNGEQKLQIFAPVVGIHIVRFD